MVGHLEEGEVVDQVGISGRRVGILLAVLALLLVLFPATALAGGSPAGTAIADGDTFAVAGATTDAFAVATELRRQNPGWKLVCERTRDLSAVVCVRWAPHKCKVPRGEEVGMRNCMGNGPNARLIL